jgi:hypothetical protein
MRVVVLKTRSSVALVLGCGGVCFCLAGFWAGLALESRRPEGLAYYYYYCVLFSFLFFFFCYTR